MGSWTSLSVVPTKYQVWSSVLGASLTTVNTAGDKVATKVFAGGTHIATQNSEGGDSLVFHTADPVTGTTAVFTGSSSIATKEEEAEPLGQSIETTDPGTSYPSGYSDVLGVAKDPEWQCDYARAKDPGEFWGLPVHCQKAIAMTFDFRFETAISWVKENPTLVAKHESPPAGQGASSTSVSNDVLATILAPTNKSDKGGPSADGVECEPGEICEDVQVPIKFEVEDVIRAENAEMSPIGENDYPSFEKGDLKAVTNRIDDARKLAKVGSRCDKALEKFGIPSISKILEDLNPEGPDANIFDGRKSTLEFEENGENTTVSEWFVKHKAEYGAAVFRNKGPTGSHVMFLGFFYFSPPDPKTTSQQRAFMIMHEAVHQFGDKRDAHFGGSRKLSQLLVEACFPILKGKLGGVA